MFKCKELYTIDPYKVYRLGRSNPTRYFRQTRRNCQENLSQWESRIEMIERSPKKASYKFQKKALILSLLMAIIQEDSVLKDMLSIMKR
jgi:hypothetical protein